MSCKIFAVGEVLWDLLPTGKQLGGAPANFSFHCRGLGALARLVTRIGDDDLGRQVLGRFRLLGLPTETVQLDPDWPTGTVAVTLADDGQPRFTIHEHVAWDRIAADETALAEARSADAVCFGSLAQRSEPSRRAIRALVSAARPEALRVFDVNLRPPFVDRDVIADSLELADVLKLNDQELPELAAMFGLPPGVREAMEELAGRFGLSVVALTRGAGGSLLMADGRWSDHPGTPAEVCDTIGAGDAFTAALTVGLLAGRPLEEINRHANEVAALVCSRPGGTPALPEALRLTIAS
jgi:fructokinase